ncbi:Uncharacterized protein FWK35_00028582, partial [Aphis craccivora]
MIITSRNNAPISNFGGGFRCKSEYPWCIIEVKSKTFSNSFQKNREKQKKNDEKTGILLLLPFSPTTGNYINVLSILNGVK